MIIIIISTLCLYSISVLGNPHVSVVQVTAIKFHRTLYKSFFKNTVLFYLSTRCCWKEVTHSGRGFLAAMSRLNLPTANVHRTQSLCRFLGSLERLQGALWDQGNAVAAETRMELWERLQTGAGGGDGGEEVEAGECELFKASSKGWWVMESIAPPSGQLW